MTMPAASQIIAGPPSFVTISNVTPVPSTTGFTVSFDTDQVCMMAMDYWQQNKESYPNGSVLEAGPSTHHVLATGTLTPPVVGATFGFSLRLNAADTSGLSLRSQQGFVRILGARTVANQLAVPVRWNNFGDGTTPPHGGAVQQGAYLVGGGNWSSYTWAQYNPKMTTYPAP